MRYVVVVMPQATRQALEIDAWWHSNRPEASNLFAEEFARVMTSLEQHPSRGRRSAAKHAHHRMLVLSLTKLVVVYRIRPRARRVEILRFKRP